jgi:hypothetical protein
MKGAGDNACFRIYGCDNRGKYRHKITTNIGVPYTGGTNAGNNN